jgi:hypothetical protein
VLVVLDTNQLFDDPFLTRPTLRALLRFREHAGFAIVLPAVVVDEGVDQYAKHLLARPERAHQELGVRQGEDDLADADPRWLDRYRARLLERLGDLEIGVLEEPDSTDVETWRSAARKPFKAGDLNNDGDARIWATVLDAARTNEIILVSNNSKDFAAGRKTAAELHPELRDDLVVRGLDAGRIMLAPTCGHALRLLGAPDVSTAEAADRLERGKGKAKLFARAVEAFESSLIDDVEAETLGLGVDLDPESVYVDSFDPLSLSVLSAFELDDTTAAVEVGVVGEALVDVFVYQADAYALPDNSPIRIHDYDYNESYAEGQAHLQLVVELETAVDVDRNVEDPAVVGVRLHE